MPERDRLILSLKPKVLAVVNRIFRSFSPVVERDDMIDEGWLGAIAAVDQFEPARGLKLTTFAELKIRGRILDYLRQADTTVTRRERRDIKAGIGTAPFVVPFEHDLIDKDSLGAFARVDARNDLRVFLHRAKLTRRQGYVLRRRYWDAALDRDVGIELGVGQSAISWIHGRAIRRLRRTLAPEI